MADGASLIEKYKGADGGDPASTAELQQSIKSFTPEWEKYDATRTFASSLSLLKPDDTAAKTKAVIQGNLDILKVIMDAVLSLDVKPAQWILTFLYDLIREDSSCHGLFEDAMRVQVPIYKPLMTLLTRQGTDRYVADKTAWLLTAVIGHNSRYFKEEEVTSVASVLLAGTSPCTELGSLEALTNLLKSDTFRQVVWAQPGLPERIFSIEPRTAPSPQVYKCVFAMWMLSFDASLIEDLKNQGAIKKVKQILTLSRVEKVVRLCLTLLKNFLSHKMLCEEVVEEGMLEVVQQLEYEKWRDSELYDDIRDMANQISSEVHELSNFERYERELQSGSLTWGYIHSPKFWAENVMKFEQNEFRAVKMMAQLLQSDSSDCTTLAVACHDVGEFVSLHPLGKKKIAQLQIKERVMQLMGTTDPEYRDVRREALLCCQKIMLNKWQDIEAIQK